MPLTRKGTVNCALAPANKEELLAQLEVRRGE